MQAESNNNAYTYKPQSSLQPSKPE